LGYHSKTAVNARGRGSAQERQYSFKVCHILKADYIQGCYQQILNWLSLIGGEGINIITYILKSDLE